MSNNIEWKCITNENFLLHKTQSQKTQTKDHPLKPIVMERIPRRVLTSLQSTGRTTPVSTPSAILEPLSLALEGLDPLTAFAIEEMDPLTKLASEESKEVPNTPVTKTTNEVTGPENWSSKRAAILSKFTTSEKITIVTSFLSEGDKVVVKAQSTVVDKVQHRLEQLDYFEEGSQTKLDLSQAEYVHRIEQLNRELVTAWNSEQRVKALKIAIQCSKLLSDTSVLPFYPSKFVLITDILDVFGKLVFSRLKNKNAGKKGVKTLPDNFTPDMVSDSAKETCLNWFYKIASIRELVPRLYIEMALLRSYTLLSTSECHDALLRLAEMINGIGNPLVAVYARCYLHRGALSIESTRNNKAYGVKNFQAFLRSYPHIHSRSVKAELSTQNLRHAAYMSLYTPALDYILGSVACDAPEQLLDELLFNCSLLGNSSLILNTIMSAFKPSLITSRTLQLLDMIDQSMDRGIQLHTMLRTLGLCVSLSPPPMEHRRQILTIVWRNIADLGDGEAYIQCAEPWTLYVVKYFTQRELNAVLKDLIDHIAPLKNHEAFYPQLKLIVENIIANVQDFESLLVMDHFLPMIDLFQQESTKVEVCKKVLVCGSNRGNMINDPVVVNALLYLCSILHDSVNALTPEDEYRQIGEILCEVVKTIDYGRDFEQQLTFYVEARQLFCNVDPVFVQLVQCVNSLSVRTKQLVKGMHTRKTADFVRACAAYTFITIPSIRTTRNRLVLYLLSGQVALFNQCLGQADACFKAALTTISELQNNPEHIPELELVSICKQFLAILLTVPDNPESGVLSLTRSLLNVLQVFPWQDIGSLVTIYSSVIDMLCAMAQETYPYHIDRVESNDSLYGSDPKFINEINKMCCVVMGEIVTKLKSMGVCKKQSYLAMELFVKVSVRNELNSQIMMLALFFWNLAAKNDTFDRNHMNAIKNYLKVRSYADNNVRLQEIVDKLK